MDIQDYMTKVSTNSSIFNSMEDGVIILSPDLNITSLNPSAELYLGYATEEVAGEKIENVLIGGEDLKASFQVVQNEQRIGSIGSLKLFRRNGESFQANLRIIPITTENERTGLLFCFMTERAGEYRLRTSSSNSGHCWAISASFARSQDPINNISPIATPGDQSAPEDRTRIILQARRRLERLTSLVKSSLTFVRPMEYKLESITLGILVSNLLERWRYRLVKLNIKYQVQADKNVPNIEGDYRALEQVFTNLINNAIEAMESTGGMLSVKYGRYRGMNRLISRSVSLIQVLAFRLNSRKNFQPFFTTKHGTD
jgi:PAS domain S-box-containing protein